MQEQEDGWRPIETAPKDGTDVLTFTPSRVPQQAIMHFTDGKWLAEDGDWYVKGPTHWRPLPAPPAQGGDDE